MSSITPSDVHLDAHARLLSRDASPRAIAIDAARLLASRARFVSPHIRTNGDSVDSVPALGDRAAAHSRAVTVTVAIEPPIPSLSLSLSRADTASW